MDSLIKNAYINGKLVLFLGAGASRSSKSKDGSLLLDGNDLAERIAKEAGWPYNKEPLSTVYSAARSTIGERVDSLFSLCYQHCVPSGEYHRLAKYPWARIYTSNIDDALEIAFRENSPQEVFVRNRNDRVADQDHVFKSIDIIKLNGSADRPDLGFIFSPQEYGKSSAQIPLWYKELGADFFQYTFVFVGTTLNEPLFYHQIEHYRSIVTSGAPKSFVITPSASPIEVASLNSLNLNHISAGLDEFVDWLEAEIPSPPEILDLAFARIPALKGLFQKHSRLDREKYANLLMGVTLVSRILLNKSVVSPPTGTIRNFFRGFKPDWSDILDEVPAQLASFGEFLEVINKKATPGKLIVLFGPAGCGKSTLLKQVALCMSDTNENNIYFIDEPSTKFIDIVTELEKDNNDIYYLFVDRLDSVRKELKELFTSGKIAKGIVIGCEGQNIWYSRLKSNIEEYCAVSHPLTEINESDAKALLDKIEKYGPWTRLSKLNKSQRVRELLDKSKRQLLIGLMETTSGVGFELLIEKDYSSLSESRKIFMMLVSLCTVNRQAASNSLINRALVDIGITESADSICRDLSGIVAQKSDAFVARHPIYARHVLECIVNMDLLAECIRALLTAFSVFPHPVVKHLDRPQSIIFKSLINHNFLKNILRNNQNKIIGIYSNFEKVFENDGLYWLQYGLAMRDFGRQSEAFDRLLTAYNAYPHDHTAHALSQQELIMALQEDVPTTKANDYLSSAIDKLEQLDKTISSDDTYPIVTLAEGHTKVAIKTRGEDNARIIARGYCDRLQKRIKSHSDQRLTEAYGKLLKFATTGVWTEEV